MGASLLRYTQAPTISTAPINSNASSRILRMIHIIAAGTFACGYRVGLRRFSWLRVYRVFACLCTSPKAPLPGLL